jgi:AcrR family transcriptional regulator
MGEQRRSGGSRSGSLGDRDSGSRRDVTPVLLLSAAKRLFAARGMHGASVRDIAAAAGVNSALVRYHFGSKEGLYCRVVDELLADFRDVLDQRLTLEARGVLLMGQLLDAFLDFLMMDEDNGALFQRALIDSPDVIFDRAHALHGDCITRITSCGLWSGAGPTGSVSDAMITLFSGALMPISQGPFVAKLTGEDPMRIEVGEQRRLHLHRWLRMAWGEGLEE